METPLTLTGPSIPTATYLQHFPQGGQTVAGSSREAERVGSFGCFAIGGGSFHGKGEK